MSNRTSSELPPHTFAPVQPPTKYRKTAHSPDDRPGSGLSSMSLQTVVQPTTYRQTTDNGRAQPPRPGRPSSVQSRAHFDSVSILRARIQAITPDFPCDIIYATYERAPTKPTYVRGESWDPTLNVYELVVRTTKALEHLLDVEFGASGTGLTGKIHNAPLDRIVKERLLWLVRMRNKLVHEPWVHGVSGGSAKFAEEVDALNAILHDHLVYRVLQPIIRDSPPSRSKLQCVDRLMNGLFWSNFFRGVLSDELDSDTEIPKRPRPP